MEPVCVADFEALAQARMSPMAWEYVSAGAADELTLRWNREAYEKIRLQPRVLVDVTGLDTRVTLFGRDHAFPILMAPAAAHTLTHPEGELATVRGANAAQATFCLSSYASRSVEEVAAAATGPLWFQLYMQTDYGFTRELVERAEAAGCEALCLTVDTPIGGARNRETRAAVTLPAMPNLTGFKGVPSSGLQTGTVQIYNPYFDAALSWKDVEWLRSFAKIPLLLKGVMNPEDAERAVEAGVAGLIVSNHGGRNLDTLPATIDALPRVTERVGGRVPVLLDGGIRRGTDVLKGLALGASAVMVGRAYLYGLAVDGANGVAAVMGILQRELMMAMALTGKTRVEDVDRSVLWD